MVSLLVRCVKRFRLRKTSQALYFSDLADFFFFFGSFQKKNCETQMFLIFGLDCFPCVLLKIITQKNEEFFDRLSIYYEAHPKVGYNVSNYREAQCLSGKKIIFPIFLSVSG